MKKITDARIAAALAWLRGEATFTQVARKFRISQRQNVAQPVVYALREAFRRGLLKDKRGVMIKGSID